MELHVLGSSSSGNCYLLNNGLECLVIEAGIKFSEVRKALNFKVGIIAGLILTHEHGDHAKHVLEYAENGINCYMTEGTRRQLKSDSHRFTTILEKRIYKIGEFRVVAFDVEHDAEQPVGYIIEHEQTGRVVFLTDTHFTKYKFDQVSTFIIEANYSEDILNKRFHSGESKAFLRDRVLRNHLSLENCIKTLEANNLSETNKIVLIHLSDQNSNAEEFKTQVEEKTGKQVFVADAGLKISINKNVFA